ncbi:hypothetical protein B0J14DRAFT_605808 [Halenospora varia]|nr:hypothetical protein B0J14DRAFT_605808 [Halenospora varia]
MPRKIDLLVYPARASKINGTCAHWALFIPSLSSNSKGKLIQVLGTPFTGYGLEFKRNYDLDTIAEKFQKYSLGDVEDGFVEDVVGDGTSSIDNVARDAIEKEAKRIDPPGVSKEPLNPGVGKRCQEWTRELVERLVERGILEKHACDVLDEAKSCEKKM